MKIPNIVHNFILGFINQSLNIITLNSLASAGYLYLKASAIADVLSILALIPFLIRQGQAHNSHSYFIMFFHVCFYRISKSKFWKNDTFSVLHWIVIDQLLDNCEVRFDFSSKLYILIQCSLPCCNDPWSLSFCNRSNYVL